MNKKFKVNFVRTHATRTGGPLEPHLRDLVRDHGHHLPEQGLGSDRFQVRDLYRVGSVWKGCFAKLRDEAPHVRRADGSEEEIVLDDGDHVMEKAFFLYHPRTNVMVWQTNRSAAGLTKAAEYFSHVLESLVTLPYIQNERELADILRKPLKEIEITYAQPPLTQPSSPRWEQAAFDIISHADAARARFTVKAPRSGHLGQRSASWIREMMRSDAVEKVRVKVTDETDPIGLFMAPLKDEINVSMDGKYPDPISVYAELELAYDRNSAHFNG